MAKNDFRVAIDFFGHPKTVKLERHLGPAAVLGLMKLWKFAAINRPKGVLFDLDNEDIAIAAKWEDEKVTADAFVAELIERRFLNVRTDGVLEIHDWEEHNTYIFYGPERSDKARRAARARHGNKSDDNQQNMKFEVPHKDTAKNDNEQCQNDETALPEVGSSNAPIPVPTPSPDPSPEPEPEETLKPDPIEDVDVKEIYELIQFTQAGFGIAVTAIGLSHNWIASLISKHGKQKVITAVNSMNDYYMNHGLPPPTKGRVRAKIEEWIQNQKEIKRGAKKSGPKIGTEDDFGEGGRTSI